MLEAFRGKAGWQQRAEDIASGIDEYEKADRWGKRAMELESEADSGITTLDKHLAAKRRRSHGAAAAVMYGIGGGFAGGVLATAGCTPNADHPTASTADLSTIHAALEAGETNNTGITDLNEVSWLEVGDIVNHVTLDGILYWTILRGESQAKTPYSIRMGETEAEVLETIYTASFEDFHPIIVEGGSVPFGLSIDSNGIARFDSIINGMQKGNVSVQPDGSFQIIDVTNWLETSASDSSTAQNVIINGEQRSVFFSSTSNFGVKVRDMISDEELIVDPNLGGLCGAPHAFEGEPVHAQWDGERCEVVFAGTVNDLATSAAQKATIQFSEDLVVGGFPIAAWNPELLSVGRPRLMGSPDGAGPVRAYVTVDFPSIGPITLIGELVESDGPIEDITPPEDVTLNAPTVTQDPTDGLFEIEISWSTPPEDSVKQYVEIDKNDGNGFVAAATFSEGETSYQTQNLPAGKYRIRISQEDESGNISVGVASDWIDAVDENAPADVSFNPSSTEYNESLGTYTINLNWQEPPSDSNKQILYQEIDGTFVEIAQFNSGETSHSIDGLNQGEYKFKLTQVDSAGNESIGTITLAETGDKQAPADIGGLDATPGVFGDAYFFNLSWEAPSEDSATQKIYISSDGENFAPIAVLGADATSYKTDGYTEGQYWIKITQTDESGNESKGTVMAVETGDLIAPEGISNLQVSHLVDGDTHDLSLNWSLSEQAMNDDTVGQEIYIMGPGDSEFKLVKTVGPNATSAEIADLASGDYQVKVVRVDEAGNSLDGMPQSFNLPEIQQPGPCQLALEQLEASGYSYSIVGDGCSLEICPSETLPDTFNLKIAGNAEAGSEIICDFSFNQPGFAAEDAGLMTLTSTNPDLPNIDVQCQLPAGGALLCDILSQTIADVDKNGQDFATLYGGIESGSAGSVWTIEPAEAKMFFTAHKLTEHPYYVRSAELNLNIILDSLEQIGAKLEIDTETGEHNADELGQLPDDLGGNPGADAGTTGGDAPDAGGSNTDAGTGTGNDTGSDTGTAPDAGATTDTADGNHGADGGCNSGAKPGNLWSMLALGLAIAALRRRKHERV